MKKFLVWMSIFAIMLINSRVDVLASTNDYNFATSSESQTSLTAEELIGKNIVSESDLGEDEILLGGTEYKIAAESNNTNVNSRTTAAAITGVVHVQSYATYSKADGVSVYIKLYAPWYTFTNPKFTSMTGYATCKLGDTSKTKSFVQVENESSTITKTVDFGMTAKSGTSGTVVVEGLASGTNIVGYAGQFVISYGITIP